MVPNMTIYFQIHQIPKEPHMIEMIMNWVTSSKMLGLCDININELLIQ